MLTAAATGVLVWRAHARRPPLIRTAEPVVAPRDALDELTGATGTSGPGRVAGLGPLPRDGVAAHGAAGGGGELRVAAVTYVQHDGRRSRGNSSHIPAPVLRAYLDAVDGAGGY